MPADPTPGSLVRRYRTEKHWSRGRLATDIHRSASWVSKVERDEIRVTDIHLLGRLAALLGAPLSEFIEASLGPDAADQLRERPYVETLRRALAGHPVPTSVVPTVSTGATPIDLGDLEVRTAEAWRLVHASSYQDLGPHLASLVADLESASRTSTEPERLKVLSLLADIYQVAAAMLVKVGDYGAAWVAADRAITAGERCGSRSLVLASQLRMAHTFLNSKEQGLSRHVLQRATLMADDAAVSDDPGLISLVGACALLLAVLAARGGESRTAARHLAMASRLASQLGGDRNDYGTEFGPTNVEVHAVAISVELGNGREALNRAERVDTTPLSRERRTRYLIDVARAHVLTRSPRDAVATLLAAEQIAPEELSDLPLVAQVIESIEDQTKHARIPALRELKTRLYG